MKRILHSLSLLLSIAFIFSACEGPMGPAGPPGANGTNGKDANQTCTLCHNQNVVEKKETEYELSKHFYGTVAFEEAGRTPCTPCHTTEGFRYVVKNNVPATFTLIATTGKYINNYSTVATDAYGSLDCFTCHDNLHTTYTPADLMPLTTTAPVPMNMWAAAKTIDLTQDSSFSNLCVKCHQPRPLTKSSSLSDGNVIDYIALASNPEVVIYDSSVGNAAPNTIIPSFRMDNHYGTVGAIFAGKGGVEFAGSLSYESSFHTTGASCQDCHMTTISGTAGGHMFAAAGNFNGCNVAGCHNGGISSSNTTFWKNPRANIMNLLDALALKINSIGGGTDILNINPDPESNLWAGETTNNYDGYINLYDASSNPGGGFRNPAPSGSWTTAQKDYNNTLPVFPSLTNGELGAIINFQLCLREFSLGIHNYKYTQALLQNSLDAMTAGV